MIPLRYNVRSLFVRKTTTIATMVGIGLVVFVLAAALMLSEGIARTLGSSGTDGHAIVLRKGSDAELSSTIETGTVSLVTAAPGVKVDETGQALAAGEVVVVVAQEKSGTDGAVSNVQVRGVTDKVMKLRPETRLVQGRPAQPGTDEVIIGERLVGRFEGMELGGQLELKKNRPLTVVGVFESGGSSFESEVWADLDTVRSSFGREGVVSSVTVALESPEKYDVFAAAVEHDKQLLLDAERENLYYEKQSEGTSFLITVMGWIIAVFFMAAAIVGAFITMNTAVANRRREIGTMRALGFSGWSVLGSFLLESLILALLGAGLGVVAAFFMTFATFSMMNFVTWSEVVFSFNLTPGIVVTAAVVGLIMGVLGGFIPAASAARTRPVEAMRG